ncbi:MAG: response regulator [Candidatus Doudnabacteria bacterium]|nr:response regulator [Candidatus Doudnabacteria bacterium]
MANILFIHPDHKLIGIYQRHLSSHFTIDSAHDGLSGLRRIRESNPGMVISENNLPYMSGLAILKYVRSHPQHYSLPFLFLTNDEMPEEALGMGATAWLRQSEHGPEQLIPHIFNNYHFVRS